MKKLNFVWIALFFLTACQSLTTSTEAEKKKAEERTFQNVKDLSAFKATAFVPTLESELPEGHNAVYASSFLFAWDLLRKEVKTIPLLPQHSKEFVAVNNSTSFLGSLNANEVETEIKKDNEFIEVKAMFSKNLPLRNKFEKLEAPLLFKNQKVQAFGMKYYDDEISQSLQILYYKNDSNFALKIFTKEKNHEIIVARGLDMSSSFSKMIEQFQKLTKEGLVEYTKPETGWKFALMYDDEISIPTINFNIETRYKNIERQQFFPEPTQQHTIVMAYQRTAFLLDEYGAIVESEAAVADSICTSAMPPENQHPKKFFCNGPFAIFLQRTDSKNPYFALKVENSELLLKK